MEKNTLSTLGLVFISLGLLVDNWRVGKKYEANKKLNEILMLQNQTYHHMVRGLIDPNVNVEEYTKEMRERMDFIDIIAQDTPKLK